MRISATTLETFRLFCDPDQEWMPESDLLDSIKGIFVPNEKVLLGQAVDAVLERPDRYRVPGGFRYVPTESDASRAGHAAPIPVLLRDDVMREPLSWMNHTAGVFQAKTAKRYGRHEVVSKADQITGARLFEHKAITGTFDPDKYADSVQWRFMVDAFEPALVTYLCIELAMSQTSKGLPEGEKRFVCNDRGEWEPEFDALHVQNLYPYPGLSRDCADLVERFAGYVESRGLTWFLDAKQRTAAGGFEWVA